MQPTNKSTIKKWGNSPALRLSTSLMQLAQMSVDQEVTIQVLKGKLVIEPIKPKEYFLEDLVNGINPENCHAESDFGQVVGKELM